MSTEGAVAVSGPETSSIFRSRPGIDMLRVAKYQPDRLDPVVWGRLGNREDESPEAPVMTLRREIGFLLVFLVLSTHLQGSDQEKRLGVRCRPFNSRPQSRLN